MSFTISKLSVMLARYASQSRESLTFLMTKHEAKRDGNQNDIKYFEAQPAFISDGKKINENTLKGWQKNIFNMVFRLNEQHQFELTSYFIFLFVVSFISRKSSLKNLRAANLLTRMKVALTN